jgi:hypothetical protein
VSHLGPIFGPRRPNKHFQIHILLERNQGFILRFEGISHQAHQIVPRISEQIGRFHTRIKG